MLVHAIGPDWPLVPETAVVGLALKVTGSDEYSHMEDGSTWTMIDNFNQWPLLKALIDIFVARYPYASICCETWPEYLDTQLKNSRAPMLYQLCSNLLVGYFVCRSENVEVVTTDQIITDTTVSTWFHFGTTQESLLNYAEIAPKAATDLRDETVILRAPTPSIWIMDTTEECKVKLVAKSRLSEWSSIIKELAEVFSIENVQVSWQEWRE